MGIQISVGTITNLVHSASVNFNGTAPNGAVSTSPGRITWAPGINQGLISPVQLGIAVPIRVIRIDLTMAGQATWTLNLVDGASIIALASGTTETTYFSEALSNLSGTQALQLLTTGGGTTAVRMSATVVDAYAYSLFDPVDGEVTSVSGTSPIISSGGNTPIISVLNASATQSGVVTTGTQTFAGAKTFSSAITSPNISGTNTGDVTLAAVGAVPNASGASLSGQVLTLQPANDSQPGLITTGTQTFAGAKTFGGQLSSSVISGQTAINLVDGARLNFSTADTLAYMSRVAAGTIGFAGTVRLGYTGGGGADGVITSPDGTNSLNLYNTGVQLAAGSAYLQGNDTTLQWSLLGLNGFTIGAATTVSPGGAASNPIDVGGRLNTQTTTAGNINGGEDTLMTYTVLANAMNVSARGYRYRAWGAVVNNINAKTIKIYFGSQILSAALPISTAANWICEATIIRTGANAQKYVVELRLIDSASNLVGAVYVAQGTLTETETNTIIIKSTATATTTDDVTQTMELIETV